MAPLFSGFRGRPGIAVDDVAAWLEELARRFAAEPRIVEIEVNPLVCGKRGVVALDALVTVAAD